MSFLPEAFGDAPNGTAAPAVPQSFDDMPTDKQTQANNRRPDSRLKSTTPVSESRISDVSCPPTVPAHPSLGERQEKSKP